MDLIDKNRVWKNLKQRLALRRMGCYGATSTPTPTATITIIEALHLGNRNHEDDLYNVIQAPSVSQVEDSNVDLAMAFAAERNFRLSNIGTQGIGKVKTLVALIEETDGVDLKKKVRKLGRRTTVDHTAGGGRDSCCVCMERNKGAAFIPCGHTFCRLCSRELWLNRGSCPICNRSITEILHIF